MKNRLLIFTLLMVIVLTGCSAEKDTEPVSDAAVSEEAAPGQIPEEGALEIAPTEPVVQANEEIAPEIYSLLEASLSDIFEQAGIQGELKEVYLTQYPVDASNYEYYLEIKLDDRWLAVTFVKDSGQDFMVDMVSEIVDDGLRYYYAYGENSEAVDLYDYQTGELVSQKTIVDEGELDSETVE